MHLSSRKALLVALVALGLTACAEEREPINRVQPNALQKKMFVGEKLQDPSDDPEFYFRGTVVDVGYGAAQDGLFTSTYAQPTSRVKFVIQEDMLIARLTYERIADSDYHGTGPASNNGIIVAAYPILKHFDIKRAYNSTTGEEMNVIEENSYDRPWYEREYMRVDWSRNMNVDAYDFDTLSAMNVFGAIKYEPLSYYVNDPTDPDAPHFADAGDYFDITTKAFARPQMVDLSHLGWGIDAIPSCMLDPDFMGGSAPTGTCNPVELTIRQSFRKIVDKDYEPEHWDGLKFQAFGAFTTDRKGYARNYGMTDDRWYRFISRYNIWDRSHVYADATKMTGPEECFTDTTTKIGEDPHRDVSPADGTEDECAAVAAKFGLHEGSRCDTFTQKCTIPFRDRKPTPLVWYVSTGSNFDQYEGTEWAANDWDVALRHAIMTARYAECIRTGDEAALTASPDERAKICGDKYPVWNGQMDDEQEAISLVREVDDCRHGVAYKTDGRPSTNEECDAVAVRLGNERGLSPAIIAVAKMPEMITLCHSPVQANDAAACGNPRLPENMTAQMCTDALMANDRATIETCNKAFNVRLGDLRYHTVNIIPIPQTPSPWGIMVDSDDPLTGEKVAASINVWSHVTDLWSQGVVDTARYIKGEITTAEITDGDYVRDWSAAAQNAGGGSAFKMDSATVQKRISDFVGTDISKAGSINPAKVIRTPAAMAKIAELQKVTKSLMFDAYAPTTTAAKYNARRQRALGSDVEAALVTKPMQELSGTTKLDINSAIQFASPLRGANPTVAREYRRMRDLALAERGVCMVEQAPAPGAIVDLADVLARKFGDFKASDDKSTQFARAESMRRYLTQRAQHSVIAHEMGHSMGMRHNFVSSSDAFNYRPQYWQLRTRNGQIKAACTDLRGATKNCVGPRYYDPITDEERKNLLVMFMNSSIMEYPGEGTQDMLGIAAYDFGAIRMFYGDAVAMHADPTYKVDVETPVTNVTLSNGGTVARIVRSRGVLSKMDNFGGMLGFSPAVGNPEYTGGEESPPWTEDIHYSQLQNAFALISDCQPIANPEIYKPARWDESKDGKWDALLDGLIVSPAGYASRCSQQKVDYVNWSQLKMPNVPASAYYRGGPAVDAQNRLRVPYGFATDRWADLGNLSVYRHDNGADPYELFDFLISQQEVNHIFDDYRRNRQTFSVRGASSRQLERYNTKMRDGAKGLGLMANIYRDLAAAIGYSPNDFWAFYASNFFRDNILASTIAFDHFTNELSRPEAGGHYLQDGVLRSMEAQVKPDGAVPVMNVFNGATGLKAIGSDGKAMFENVGFGGRPVENKLSQGNGEYSTEYTMNCGSYYEKLYSSMLLTESVDNFISDSLTDFVDGRYRAVSLADLFPEGYRRWLANNLTEDDDIKGQRVKASLNATTQQLEPIVEGQMMWPKDGLARVSWAATEPVACFQNASSLGVPGLPNQTCTTTTDATLPVDPQVGWEQFKFLIAWTMLYLPENQQRPWLDMMHIWEKGVDSDPGFADRIEFHHPSGRTYIARVYGKETIFGKTVQKGISARVLEYANSLLKDAYDVDGGPDLDNDGTPDWYTPRMGANGLPTVKFDAGLRAIGPDGQFISKPGCNAQDNSKCECNDNRACRKLSQYAEVPYFMRQTMAAYGLNNPSERGVY